jgi:hypothetical protein
MAQIAVLKDTWQYFRMPPGYSRLILKTDLLNSYVDKSYRYLFAEGRLNGTKLELQNTTVFWSDSIVDNIFNLDGSVISDNQIVAFKLLDTPTGTTQIQLTVTEKLLITVDESPFSALTSTLDSFVPNYAYACFPLLTSATALYTAWADYEETEFPVTVTMQKGDDQQSLLKSLVTDRWRRVYLQNMYNQGSSGLNPITPLYEDSKQWILYDADNGGIVRANGRPAAFMQNYPTQMYVVNTLSFAHNASTHILLFETGNTSLSNLFQLSTSLGANASQAIRNTTTLAYTKGASTFYSGSGAYVLRNNAVEYFGVNFRASTGVLIYNSTTLTASTPSGTNPLTTLVFNSWPNCKFIAYIGYRSDQNSNLTSILNAVQAMFPLKFTA